MFLRPEIERNFPQCLSLLQGLSTSLTSQPRLREAFFLVCTAELQRRDPRNARTIAERGLVYGQPPSISLKRGVFEVRNAGAIQHACGFYNTIPGVMSRQGKAANILELTDIWFRAFEFPADQATRKAAERFLTTTTLHELIHWARDQNDAGDTIDDTLAVGTDRPKQFGPDAEAGHVFEELASGIPNVCTFVNLRIATKGLIDLDLGI